MKLLCVRIVVVSFRFSGWLWVMMMKWLLGGICLILLSILLFIIFFMLLGRVVGNLCFCELI